MFTAGTKVGRCGLTSKVLATRVGRPSTRTVRRHAAAEDAQTGVTAPQEVVGQEAEFTDDSYVEQADEDVDSKTPLSQLKEGDVKSGIVRSVTDYGCFVDIGSEVDGLVHISQVSDSYVNEVSDVVQEGQFVTVRVIGVMEAEQKIALSMKGLSEYAEDDYETDEDDEEMYDIDMDNIDLAAYNIKPDIDPDSDIEEEEEEEIDDGSKPKLGQKFTASIVRFSAEGAIVQLEGYGEAILPLDVDGDEEDDEEDQDDFPYDIGDSLEVEVVGRKKQLAVIQTIEDDESEEPLAFSRAPTPSYPGDVGEEWGDSDSYFSIFADVKNLGVEAALGVDLNAQYPELAAELSEPPRYLKFKDKLVRKVDAMYQDGALRDLDDEARTYLLRMVWKSSIWLPPDVYQALKEGGGPEPIIVSDPEAAPAGEAPATEPEPAAAAAAESDATPAPVAEESVAAPESAPVAEVPPAVDEPVAEPELAPVAEAPPAVEEPAAAESKAAPEPVADSAPAAATGGAVSAALVKELRGLSGAGMMDCKKALAECNGDVQAAQEFLRKKGLASADKKAGRIAAEGLVVSYIHAGSRLGVMAEVNCETDFVARGDSFKEFAEDIAMQIAASDGVKVVSVDDVSSEDIEKEKEIEMQKQDVLAKPENVRGQIVEGRLNKIKAQQALLEQAFIKSETGQSVADAVKEKIAELGENITVRRFVRYQLGEGLQKKEEDFAAEVAAQTAKKEDEPAAAVPAAPEAQAEPAPAETPAVKVDLKLVQELRSSVGAGMMDCKKALAETNNNVEEATAWLRKKGLASADKKAGRIAAEGVVESYIHAGSALGVLIEVNCETDFVSKGDVLKELAVDMAMQVAANPDVQYVSVDDIPQSVKDAEYAIESGKEDLQGKPEAQIPRIVEGRVNKAMTKMCLLEQDFIKDTNKKVDVVIKEAIAKTGENIKVRKFTRFILGEGIEKKQDDFAAEVAAQTGQA